MYTCIILIIYTQNWSFLIDERPFIYKKTGLLNRNACKGRSFKSIYSTTTRKTSAGLVKSHSNLRVLSFSGWYFLLNYNRLLFFIWLKVGLSTRYVLLTNILNVIFLLIFWLATWNRYDSSHCNDPYQLWK